uniref:GM12657p n=1 Tax=Drosophila melanogaster TaxID=7227 RepID=Q8MSG2_DROME|nr:GM12657p [Drosophila melanogaster]
MITIHPSTDHQTHPHSSSCPQLSEASQNCQLFGSELSSSHATPSDMAFNGNNNANNTYQMSQDRPL